MTRFRLTALRFGAPLAGALLLGGCVSGSDIDRLHQHIGDVEKKVDELSRQSSSKEEVAKLNDNLTKQSAALLRSNADLGTRFEELIRELMALSGKLEDANRRLAALSQQIAETQARMAAQSAPAAGAGSAPGAAPGSSPAAPAAKGPSPSDLFAQATADYQRGQFELARQGFEDYAATYPSTDLSDDAIYWAGECYSASKKPKEAIAEWDRLIAKYPQSDKLAAAHLKKGLAHLDMGEKAQAIVQLQFVVHQYPGSDEAKSARQRLRTLGSDAR